MNNNIINDYKNIIGFYGTSKERHTVKQNIYTKQENVNINNLITFERNKKHLFKYFNEDLRFEYVLTNKDAKIFNLGFGKSLSIFLGEHKQSFSKIITLFLFGFINNNIVKDAIYLTKDYQFFDITFKKGMKITKCFKLLEKDEKRLREQQDMYSTFVQSLKPKTKLIFSINPIDFLTMSVSTNWGSCLHPNRIYGLGNLFFMNERNSILVFIEKESKISYLCKDEDENIINKTIVKEKEWRQLIHFDGDLTSIALPKQYPFEIPMIDMVVLNGLKEMMSRNFIKKKDFYFNIDENDYNGLAYPDIFNNDRENRYYTIRENNKDSSYITFESSVFCSWNGDEIIYIDTENGSEPNYFFYGCKRAKVRN